MSIYFIMLFVTSAFALMSFYLPAKKSVEIGNGRIFSLSPRNICYFLSFLPLFLVSACRYMIGVDYNSYAWIFTAITQTDEKTHVEIGYELLNRFCALLSNDFVSVFVASSLIILFFFAVAIYENSEIPALSVFLFVSLGYFFYSLNSVRHFMALAIFFFASRYMKKVSVANFLKFALLILVAASFHKIAFIAIPIYFVFTRKFSMRYYAIIGVLLVICAVLNKQILNFIFTFVYSSYKGSVYNVYDFSVFNVLLCVVAVFFAIAYYKPLLLKDKANIIYINAAIFMLLFYLTCWWIPTPTRIGHFGTIFFILLFPKALSCEKNPKVKRLYTVLLIAFALIFLIVMLIGAKDPAIGLVPYRSIFSRFQTS